MKEVDTTKDADLYRISFGIPLTKALDAEGYKRCGRCKMDNGKEGIIYQTPERLRRSGPSPAGERELKTLCEVHDAIEEASTDGDGNTVVRLTRLARKMGERMEARLLRYRRAIEVLGFRRDK